MIHPFSHYCQISTKLGHPYLLGGVSVRKPSSHLIIQGFLYRFLEFNGIVNKCLRKNPSTRQKELYIRTYAVIPLSEKAGLVEWIPNLMPLRQIILKLHRETGTGLSSGETNHLIVQWNKAPAGR